MITGHVMEEITDHYPEQQARLNAALADGTLEVVTVPSRFRTETAS